MPGKKSASAKRRTQVKSLPKRNKKLTGTDLKKVKGGGVKMGDIQFTHPIDKPTPILN
jgi:type VI protein secretion system component Hcp